MNAKIAPRRTCRSCGGDSLASVLDFGLLYVSNFVDAPDPDAYPQVPLELVLCAQCQLLQLRHTTPAEWLYRHYWYKSGVNASMRAALGQIAAKARQFAELRPGDSVLDIGCNDGTLLRSYGVERLRRIGFEPAQNLAEKAREGADRIIPDFFHAEPVSGERFKVITSIAMFYDLEDPNAFVADVARCLAADGVWVIEMHYLPSTLARNAFDAVCHEHLEYYSLGSLEPLLVRHGLRVADVETNEVNGGSFRVWVVPQGSPVDSTAARSRVEAMRAVEQGLRLDCEETYEQFGARIRQIGQELDRLLEGEARQGRQVAACGASTKGNTLLQVYKLDHTRIRSAAERNPEKWGKYTVGSWIPIRPEAEVRAETDDFLVLPWHFLAEIQKRERKFLARGGRLIAPLPEPGVIEARRSRTHA